MSFFAEVICQICIAASHRMRAADTIFIADSRHDGGFYARRSPSC